MKETSVFVSEELLQLVPKKLVVRHRVLPLTSNQFTITLAMADPNDIVAIDDVNLATGLRVEPIVYDEEVLEHMLAHYYGLDDIDHEGIMQEALARGEAISYSSVGEEEATYDIEFTNAPIVRIVNVLIHKAVTMKASDIHIEPMQELLKVRFRKDGVLQEITNLPATFHGLIVSRIKVIGKMDIAEKRLPQDGRATMEVNRRTIDLRISTMPTIHGEKIVLRLLDQASMVYSLESLGMEENALEIYKELMDKPHGMVLFTGPTGSGKTTSLYASLSYLKDPMKNIVTIEDPVEVVLPGIVQTGVNEKSGLTFSSGLRAILRQDPDVIMLGEIRDVKTAAVAVQAAITGHLLLSTLHTNNAPGALVRLIDMGIEPFLVSSAVHGIIAQRLVRKICENCKEVNFNKQLQVELFQGVGCINCQHTGYNGRTAIFEILPITNAIHESIIGRASAGELLQCAIREGMITLEQDGMNKAKKGITTLEEVQRVTLGIADKGSVFATKI